MEVLSHDVIESILEKVPVKSLVRFKSVSKRWKSTIESESFQRRQSIHRQQSPVPEVLFLTYRDRCSYYYDTTGNIPSSSSSFFSFYVANKVDDHDQVKIISSSPVTSIKVRTKKWVGHSNSCDGLLCLCNQYESVVINPTTRWHRPFPPSNLQKNKQFELEKLGFGKDKFNGTYKSVWLYNNTVEFDNKNTITTCEVFDFRNNAWRYVTCPASAYDISPYNDTVHLEGSLYWLTNLELETQVLSFDLHTETFQVIAKPPFSHAPDHMCNLNNRLCVSETEWPNQVIWLFDSGSKTWTHLYSIDLITTYSWFWKSTKYKEVGRLNWIYSFTPLAVLEEKNEKIKVLFYFDIYSELTTYFLIYDGQTKSFEFPFRYSFRDCKSYPICCSPSLISI